MITPLNISPEEFLRPFFDSGEIVHLRVFDDKKGGTFKGQKLECEMSRVDSLIDTLRDHNAQDRGIFFVVNSGGARDEDICRINAVFVENDSLSVEEQIARLDAFELPPSLMIKTAKSIHAYWLVKDVQVTAFRGFQKRLIAQFDGDPSCVNESRVLRLPGFYHCKGEPVMVECIKFAPELRYTAAQLDAVLPCVVNDSPATAPSPKGTRKGVSLVEKRCDFIQCCRDNAETLPENLWYAMITNLAVFENGDKAIHSLSKAHPGYSRSETGDKIAHFLESGTKPMTCAKIAELGFKCLKLEDGSCECKSPAALCFKPLSSPELLEQLQSIEIRQSQLENIQALRSFVLDMLYNVEPVIAETLINHNAKERFNLKAADLRPLILLYRDVRKKYTDSKETRRETEGSGLPDWYEVTDRGGLRFLPGILADHMSKNVDAFYGAGSYYFYERGVYVMHEDIWAHNAIRQFMIMRGYDYVLFYSAHIEQTSSRFLMKKSRSLVGLNLHSVKNCRNIDND